MAQHGPLVTAVVVVGGLIGFITVNSAGGLVEAGGSTPVANETTAPTTRPPAQPTTSSTVAESPPTTSQPPPPPEETPPPPAFPAEVVYAGKAAQSPLAIAVAVKGGAAAAYLCDGADVEAWLRGTAAAGRLQLTSQDGSSSLTGGLDGQNLTGSVSVGGRSLPFTIGVAPPPAGLYRANGADTTIGWIVLPDGSQVGIAKTNGATAPAPVLDPSAGEVTIDGASVPAKKLAGDSSFR